MEHVVAAIAQASRGDCHRQLIVPIIRIFSLYWMTSAAPPAPPLRVYGRSVSSGRLCACACAQADDGRGPLRKDYFLAYEGADGVGRRVVGFAGIPLVDSVLHVHVHVDVPATTILIDWHFV
jgi:hypothetical protein